MEYFLMYILDNTFFGALLAGTILASFALFQYKKQKQIDNKNAYSLKIRDAASDLYSEIVDNCNTLISILEDEKTRDPYSTLNSDLSQNLFWLQVKKSGEKEQEFSSKKSSFLFLLKMHYVDINKEFPYRELEESLSSFSGYIALINIHTATHFIDAQECENTASEIKKLRDYCLEEIEKIYKGFRF
jgi:hypothetical protein